MVLGDRHPVPYNLFGDLITRWEGCLPSSALRQMQVDRVCAVPREISS